MYISYDCNIADLTILCFGIAMAAPNKRSLFDRKRASLLSLLRIGSLRSGRETTVSSEQVNKGDRRSLVRPSDDTITQLHDGGTEAYSAFLGEFPGVFACLVYMHLLVY
jgi:hypothetical protein